MADADPDADRSLLAPLLSDDGRHLLTVAALGLMLAGGFAIFLAAAGQFLPQDIQYLGMDARQLCGVDDGRIFHFMQHDRVAFGGVLVSIAVLHLWLIAFPLRDRQPWAWWTLVVSTAAGFASFGLYLVSGYVDSWHGVATLVLLPLFGGGLLMSHGTLPSHGGVRCLLAPGEPTLSRGRWVLMGSAVALFVGGIVVAIVGVTVVFVPQDLAYMRATPAVLNAINPRLVPLIAHDRAGFGSGVLNLGFLAAAIVWCGRPTRSRWQALAVATTVGFGLAIGVHPAVGYNSAVHLAPAYAGAAAFAVGLWMTRPRRPAVTGRVGEEAAWAGST